MKKENRQFGANVKGFKEIAALLVCLLLIALIFATGVLNKQKVWPDLQLEYRDGKKTFSIADGDSY